MTGFKAYRYFLALKLHFTTDKFNVFENKGNVRGSFETFQARNDRHIFDKLARKFATDQELIQWMVAQFVYNNHNFIYNIAEGDANYIEWVRVKESITKVFADDLNQLQLEHEKHGHILQELINCTLNDFPIIIKLYLGKRIHPHTIAILSNMSDEVSAWLNNKNLALVLEAEIRVLYKMHGFFKYDKKKLSKIFNEFIANCDVGLINKNE
jgi:hypothetical protein